MCYFALDFIYTRNFLKILEKIEHFCKIGKFARVEHRNENICKKFKCMFVLDNSVIGNPVISNHTTK